jgi:hypothetical protein
LFLTKEVYTQYKPWWMSLFSFGLLLPVPLKMDVRLVPWPFKQHKHIEWEYLTVMGPFWTVLMKEFGGIPIIA